MARGKRPRNTRDSLRCVDGLPASLTSTPHSPLKGLKMFSCEPGCTEIIHLDRIEISAEPFSWEFAAVHRAEIREHFASLKRKRSAIWNGRVLLLKRFLIRDATLRGSCFETDYASFIA
jgi:hypothetical protein